MDVGGDVCSMSCSPNEQLLVATGGKENDLKLWDGSRPEAPPIFKARNVSNFKTFLFYKKVIPMDRFHMITWTSGSRSG